MFYIVLDLVMGVIMFLFGMLFYRSEDQKEKLLNSCRVII